MTAKKTFFSVLMIAFVFSSIAMENMPNIEHKSILSGIDLSKNIQPFYTKQIETTKKTAMFLCSEILSTNDITVKCNILFLMGLFPDEISIPTLITNLSIRNPEYDKPMKERPFLPQYPAHDSLIKIGMSSLSAVKQTFLNDEDKMRRDLCLSIIYQLYTRGVGNEKALLFLKLTLKDEVDSINDKARRMLLQNEVELFVKQYKSVTE